MRWPVQPRVAWLLVALTSPLAAQRPARPAAVKLEEPRPAPVFPLALVPFTIPSELCQGGRTPTVTFRVYDNITKPVNTLRLRDGQRQPLDGRPLRCGRHVAVWDGTIDNGARVAPPNVYYLYITAELPDTGPMRDTFKLVVQSN